MESKDSRAIYFFENDLEKENADGWASQKIKQSEVGGYDAYWLAYAGDWAAQGRVEVD